MRIAHLSDLHYCPKYFDEVDKCTAYAVNRIIDEQCDCVVISGDIFEQRIDLHDPCVYAVMRHIRNLAEHMPVLILQGTFSHDTPGSLNVFKNIGGCDPVHVADSISQVALIQGVIDDRFVWIKCDSGYTFDDLKQPFHYFKSRNQHKLKALFSCLPPVNKGHLASVNPDDTARAAGEYVYDLMRGWSVINEQAAAADIPTVLVSHGTVNNCVTEQGVPMHGNDHEFTTGALFASCAGAVMLGHIHQHQEWVCDNDVQTIAYPGSIGRLHFGELSDKGFLIWDIGPYGGSCDFIQTPAKKLIQIEFDETPDIEKLKAIAEGADGAHVRIRYNVNEEHKDSINKDELREIFGDAEVVKIEGRIKPVTRIRAEGITRAHSLEEKLNTWCDVTETNKVRMVERLRSLQLSDPTGIIDAILPGIEIKISNQMEHKS